MGAPASVCVCLAVAPLLLLADTLACVDLTHTGALSLWNALTFQCVSAGPQEASTAGLLASKRFSEASGGPPSQNEWKTNASAGPPEGLSRRTIGKQAVFAHAEAWSRWASRGPQRKMLENKQFAWVLRPGQGGPQEGLNHRTIGKQMVFVIVGIILRPVRPGTL